MKRLPQCLLIVVMALSIGLHWALLQGMAWTGMVVSYAKKYSPSRAIEMTFSGRNPCALCKLVAEGQRSEKQNSGELKTTKLDLVAPDRPCESFFPTLTDCRIERQFAFSSRVRPPEDPPPLG